MSKPIVVIAGPTAVGKTALALDLAQHLSGEIVNIDSVQVYRGLDIGSAKPSLAERSIVPHHLFDILDPTEQGTVADYITHAHAKISGVQQRRNVPLCVGGTGLYLTALLHGLAKLPKADAELRASLEKQTNEALRQDLKTLDPAAAERLHPNDRVRIIRALESARMLGSAVSEVLSAHAHSESSYKALIIVPLISRDELYRRIDERTRKMLELGLVEEVRGLAARFGFDIPAFNAIGYRETAAVLRAGGSTAELSETIARNTRRFAKRQLTYWRNEPQKRGWRIRPASGDEVVTITGTSPLRSANIKAMDALPWTRERLCSEVSTRLSQPFESNEVWFVRSFH